MARAFRGVRIVRHHDDRLLILLVQSLEESKDSAPDLASKSPVGSSASSIVGSVTTARAIATRCSWPPESCLG